MLRRMNGRNSTGRPKPQSVSAAAPAQLLLPRPSLAGCVLAAIVRDTRNLPLKPEQRFNFFPASPFCALTWYFEGSGHLLGAVDLKSAPKIGAPLPQLFFSGPHSGPMASWNPGPIEAMTVSFYPEAWAALTGRSAGEYVNKTIPIDSSVEGDLLALCRNVFSPGTCEERLGRFEDGLEPLWQAARPSGHSASRWLRDWTKALGVRAAVSGAAMSTRQVQRRIKAWTGQSRRDLLAHSKTEHLFENFLAAMAKGSPDPARLAAEAGFADQSHMGRHVRRVTGLPPQKIGGLIETDERFWCYRLLGQVY
jgi:AraC-like DNA-binding protein